MGTHTSINTASGSIEITPFIEEHLRSAEHSWSIGISGAIGEFMYDNDEHVDITVANDQISAITERGAMRIDVSSELKCIAYEEPSPCTKSWSQSVAFCLPEPKANTPKYNVLTELGADHDAIVDSSSEKLLFDMGVGSSSLQFCVRTDDNELIAILRNNCGRPIFEPGNPASQAILDTSPARIVISALGRMEIENKIPTSASEVLVGPHTHLLPALLKSMRPGFTGLPEGYIEALTLYPEHPAFDKYGQKRDFKQSAYDNFQKLLKTFGPQNYYQEKSLLKEKILQGAELGKAEQSNSPWQKHAFRILKMQTPYLGVLNS